MTPALLGLDRLARPLAQPTAWLLGRRQAYLLWRLRRAIRDADAFDVVANMFLTEAPISNEPGDGSDGTRLLPKPELTALLFAERRGHGAGPFRTVPSMAAEHPPGWSTLLLRAVSESVSASCVADGADDEEGHNDDGQDTDGREVERIL